MTLKVDLETRIGRSPAAVFAELVALERYPQWLIATGVTAVQLVDPGPLRPGTRLRIAQAVAGRATTLEGSVTGLEPDRRFALQAKDREGINVASFEVVHLAESNLGVAVVLVDADAADAYRAALA